MRGNPGTWPRSAAEAATGRAPALQPVGGNWQPPRTEAADGLAAMQAFVDQTAWRITKEYADKCLEADRALTRVRLVKAAAALREALELLDVSDDEVDAYLDGAEADSLS